MNDFSLCTESNLTGIQLQENSKIHIHIRKLNQEPFMIVLEGVDRFVLNEFREQNIVDRVTVWDSDSDLNNYVRILKNLLSGSFDDEVDPRFTPMIDKEIVAIKSGNKILLEIEPVYGAWITALAKTAYCVPESSTL